MQLLRRGFTRNIIISLAVAALLAPAAYFALQQQRENEALDAFLSRHALQDAPVTHNTALQVAAAVRRDFNTDEANFQSLDHNAEPFLRSSSLTLLSHREGLCGEGTRVIINLLGRLGFDATRVSLYDEHLDSVHTLVSVTLDGKEFLLDSINSTPEVTSLLEEFRVSSRDFRLKPYVGNLHERRQQARRIAGQQVRKELAALFEKYELYSYEAIPYSKLYAAIGADVRAFNFDRPSPNISLLAERPYTVYALVSTGAAAAALTLGFAGHRLYRALPRRRQTAVRWPRSQA